MKTDRRAAKTIEIASLLILSIIMITPAMPTNQDTAPYGQQAFDVSNHSLEVRRALTLDQRKRLSTMGIRDVTTSSLADEHLFDRPIFPELKSVLLHSVHNHEHLKALAHNFSGIKILAIIQTDPLTDDELSLLSNFRKLSDLQIESPIEHPGQLACFMPNRVHMLITKGTDVSSKQLIHEWNLPNLTELHLDRENIGKGFFSQLNAPKLTILDITNSNIERGALPEISKFKHLSNFLLDYSTFDKDELDGVQRAAPHLLIHQATHL